MRGRSARGRRPFPWFKLLLAILFVAFLSGGIYCGYLLYVTVRDMVARSQFPSLAQASLPPIVREERKSNISTAGEPLPDWERKERVNILILGLDQREGEPGPWRTDTMMVLTIDPENKTAGLLSIPRDLWVHIPAYDKWDRINTAHFWGELNKYPGGGPALAMKTVYELLGEPIHYYVRVNFSGFVRAIDLIGGVDVYVEEDIYDPQYPDDNYGYEPLYIPAGQHHFDGEMALKYIRTRHGSSDFDRLRRQQQVIMAARDRVMRLDLLPKLLPKLPQLMRELSDAVQTDLQLDEIMRLAKLADEIEPDRIQMAVIDSSMTMPAKTPEGWDVLLPIPEKIRELRNRLFASSVQLNEAQIEDLNKLAAEGARIAVRNGTPAGSMAARVAAFLREQGFQVVEYSNADRFDYRQTLIVDYTGKSYTVRRLAQLFGIPPENVRPGSNPQGAVDICLIIGEDLELPGE
ncbi:MAG TPA: LytR family transcriptional regulator [Anaerolineae bacterium]|nr:LytR family transcriptional regulator [Anaerolineae bacterium]